MFKWYEYMKEKIKISGVNFLKSGRVVLFVWEVRIRIDIQIDVYVRTVLPNDITLHIPGNHLCEKGLFFML